MTTSLFITKRYESQWNCSTSVIMLYIKTNYVIITRFLIWYFFYFPNFIAKFDIYLLFSYTIKYFYVLV